MAKPINHDKEKELEQQASYIWKTRKEIDFSLYDISSLLGVTPDTFSHWERGGRIAPYAAIEMLDMVYSVCIAFDEISKHSDVATNWREVLQEEGVSYMVEYLLYLSKRGYVKKTEDAPFQRRHQDKK